MGLIDGRWHVQRGDCLWNIALSVYGNGYRWTEIADVNGISQSKPTIYSGQIFDIPGITPGSSAVNSSPAPVVTTTKPNIDWLCLVAGSQREMLACWTYSGATHFWTRWEQWDNSGHLILISESTNTDYSSRAKQDIGTGRDTPGWNVIRFSVRPVDDNGNPLPNTDWGYKEYDFRNNAPDLPPTPSISIDNQNKLTVLIDNIDEHLNADSIEIAVYQNDETKYKTAKVRINFETLVARYETTVDTSARYKVRCRAVRDTIYGGWTPFSSSEESLPSAPKEITILRPERTNEQGAITYGVFAQWDEAVTAKNYKLQYTTDPSQFDISGGNVTEITTEEGAGPKCLVNGIDTGHQYYFRVASINNKGQSIDWSAINSVIIGVKPSPPTTWSNTVSAVIGEDLNLYWTHNSADGSLETYARIHFKIEDYSDPSAQPIEYDKVIQNTKPEEQQDSPSVYTINTSDQEWSYLTEGYVISWKVQTAGVGSEYSNWSVERKVTVYAQPTISLDIKNKNQVSVTEINDFPFYIDISARPYSQTPISYYVEVVSNSSYTTVDDLGNIKTINVGDKVYKKYFDPENDAWSFILNMTPNLIDLESTVNYTVNATVSMNSGLTALASESFDVYLTETYYQVSADVVVNNETIEASIHPYCNEFDEYETPSLLPNCTLSVYRKEYDGSFTEIAKDVPNQEDLYVTDPHPSLDYARYRIVARNNDTGSISYNDVMNTKVGVKAAVIQWAETWTNFRTNDNNGDNVEPAWSGSMLKIPYNIDISVSNDLDVSLIEYVGRKHPVSYYGTQLGEKFNWKMEIPATDEETLYGIRRLSNWAGNVYVRDPSGIGYWAAISVNYDKTHNEVTIPITFNVTRVEGGM